MNREHQTALHTGLFNNVLLNTQQETRGTLHFQQLTK
jgi:hypothetical protein